MLLTYIGTNGATVTYSIDNADKTEHTAATGTGVTALKVGATYTVYGVTVASRPKGGTVHWYEGGVYQASESLPDDVLTPLAVVDANVDAILEDTGTTLPAAVAAIPTNPLLTDDTRIDNLDASVSSRSTLTAQQVWASETRALTEKSGFSGEATNMRGTDNAATAADLAVVDGIVDDILVDTGTTLPAAVAAIPTNPLLTNDVRLDAVADIDEMLTFLTAYFSNRLTTTTNAGVRTVTLYDTDGTTPLKTWTYTVATNERSAGA